MADKREVQEFKENGYVVIENFISQEDVKALKKECFELVDEMNPEEHHTVFSTTKQGYRDNYFINSCDRIGYFFEEGAQDKEGNLLVEKHKSLNKIGHALHVFSPNFKRVTHNALVKKIAKNLTFKDPTVVQSMYIFKQPKIGGEVVSHQDASYLYTEPLEGKVVGIWIALEDATEENGCLWFMPGSHKSGLYGKYQMVRNPSTEGPSCIYEGEKPTYDDDKFIAVPVKAGDGILIDGLVIHKSSQNVSENSRNIYTFHIYDKAEADWSEKNWLQETEAKTFTHLYEVDV